MVLQNTQHSNAGILLWFFMEIVAPSIICEGVKHSFLTSNYKSLHALETLAFIHLVTAEIL